MRINFYDARTTDDGRTVLVKERGTNYGTLQINSPEKVSLMMRVLLHMDELAEEHCYMIALDSPCRILGIFFLSKGTVSASPMGPREIFMRAALIGAVQIILCHNHPSGCTAPSGSDIELTRRIKEAGILLNIPLADHIIIGRDGYLSFKEEGLL